MGFKRKLMGTVLTCSTALVGCEAPTQNAQLEVAPPLASLNAKRQARPEVAQAFRLLKEERYKEASQFINEALQSHPKSVILHVLNGLTYEHLTKHGDVSGNELAAVGYQSAINLDPNNVFAIVQLGKLKYNEKLYDQAQEHFANALLLKPNDPELWHELAASSYYAYDIKTALSAITRAEKLNPSDPLIHRSAAMINAALGNFNDAKKHFGLFQEKAGEDPAVSYLAGRLGDWESLYKSGRIKLAAAQSPSSAQGTPTNQPPSNGSSPSGNAQNAGGSSSGSAGSSSGSGGSSDGSAGSSDGLGGSNSDDMGVGTSEGIPSEGTPGQVDGPGSFSEAAEVTGLPFSSSSDSSNGSSQSSLNSQQNPQIIIDCYMLSIAETASTTKGNNILENLAVTFNPGEYTVFKGNLWGKGAERIERAEETSGVSLITNAGYKAFSNNLATTPGNGAPSVFNPSQTTIGLNNKGSIMGRVFTAGLSWAGLTYNLNIANAVDMRIEVVSRPSLMTFVNKPSVFFSGRELASGLVGQFSGTIVRYPVGVTLQITPKALEADLVTLDIAIEGSIIDDPDPDLQATVDTDKTRIDTYAKVRLGETLVLGGLYERAALFNKSGFPGLQDVPVLQYFFSKEQTQDVRRSVVFMLTPRSPDAVKAHINRAMTREAVEPHISELAVRNPDWFNTHPNLVEIFRYLARDPIIYYEFRSGDILPPSWGWEIPLNEKLHQLESFLYF